MKKTFLALLLAGVLAGALVSCAAPPQSTPYNAASSFLSYGYSEMPVDSITYLVAFIGNGDTPRELMNRYVLYRSAELTRQKGYDHFLYMNNWREGDIRMVRMFHGPGDIANSYEADAIITTMAPQMWEYHMR